MFKIVALLMDKILQMMVMSSTSAILEALVVERTGWARMPADSSRLGVRL